MIKPLPLVVAQKISSAIFGHPRIVVALLIITICAIIIYFKSDNMINGKQEGFKISMFLLIIVGILGATSLIVLGGSNFYTSCGPKEEYNEDDNTDEDEESDDEQ